MMLRNLLLRAALAASALISSAPLALAHPHVWVTMRSDVVVNDKGLVTGINLIWTFDDGYQEAALDGLDTDGDGNYSQSELEPLTKENMTSLKDYDYFTHPKSGSESLAVGEATEFGQIYSNGRLELYFSVPLKTPVDPRTTDFYYRIYDPEFFIAMDYVADDPVSVVGSLPEGCKLEVLAVAADEQTEQTRQMLATKGKEWQPPPDEDFGAMFAQPVHVACKK